MFNIESFGISDQGLVRDNNEDVWNEIPMHRFFVLADGMGGHNAGEIAAKEAVHFLSTSVCQLFSSRETPNPIENISGHLHSAIIKTNQWVHQLSEQKAEFKGMGTTLCCFLIHQQSLIYAHVGDSRIYRFRRGLQCLTNDHSLRSEMIRLGQLDPKESYFPHKNIITRAIGTHPTVEPDISVASLENDDIYFLCSDGLTDYVCDSDILRIIEKASSIKQASYELVNAAKAKGGNDNISIVMIRVLQ